ncbi:tape measure protein [Neptunicella sp.]|uniref:tape measure protein n=1 Tax=Neptunicella sp. TaxID=2125986 RepID=UPI003F69446D
MGKTVLAELVTRMTVDSAEFKKELEKTTAKTYAYSKTARTAANDSRIFDKSMRSATLPTRKLGSEVLGLSRAFGAVSLTLAATKLSSYIDQYLKMDSQLKLVSKSQRELNEYFNKLNELSSETRTALESNVTLYAKLTRATSNLGYSQEEVLKITKAVSQSFVISGSDAQETAGAIKQLSQALAASAFRGDEFNSVAEAAPRLMKALTDELGVNIDQLRQMAAQGQLTSEILSSTLLNQAEKIEKEFGKVNKTIGQSAQVMENSAIVAIGKLDELFEVSKAVGRDLENLAAIIEGLGISFEYLGNKKQGIQDIFSLISDSLDGGELSQLKSALADQFLTAGDVITKSLGIVDTAWDNSVNAWKDKLSTFNRGGIDAPIIEVTDGSILDGLNLFSDTSIVDEYAKKSADSMWQSFQDQLQFNAEFNAESAELQGLVFKPLLPEDYDFSGLINLQDQEAQIKFEHFQKLEEMQRQASIRQQQIQEQTENGMFNYVASMADQTATLIEQSAKDGTAIQKAAFLIQKSIAVATTVVNTEMAAAAALAPPPIGLGPVAGLTYSNVIRSLGYASAGIIAGQTIASFEGGGYIPDGPRSGGMDGRGGRLAVVHPDESIVDHKVDGPTGGGVNITFSPVLNDVSGYDQWYKNNKNRIIRDVQSATGRRI